MKKKVVLLSLALMLLLTGVVSAAALWGQYKGYDIVRLTSNGKTIKATDAPAINFNSRTMIPIYMLKEAGVNYSWDQETRTVDIQKSSSSNASYVKFLYTLTEHFDTLQAIGKDLDTSYWVISSANNAVQDDYQVDKYIENAYSSLNKSIDWYNDYVESSDKLLPIASQAGINISVTNTILNNYISTIDDFKLALSSLENYYISKESHYMDEYFDYIESSLDTLDKGLQVSFDQKYIYYNKALNY